jgi:hypothetical protein
MFNRDSFTVEEWGQIISAPAAVGALVVTADPSGPMGLIGEFRAIMSSMKEYVEANAAGSPLLAAIRDYMATKPSDEEEAQLKEWANRQQEEMKANKPKTPEELNTRLHESVDKTLDMLAGKGASEVDIRAFKSMMVNVAEKVADASKEGGFLGFGGVRVSEREQSVLNQIRSELSL